MKVQSRIQLTHVKNIPIFEGLTKRQLQFIIDGCETEVAQPGEIIIEEGRPVNAIRVVIVGTVSVLIGVHESPIEIERGGKGTCIGELSVLGILNNIISTRAVQRTKLIVIPQQFLIDLQKVDNELFSLVILNLARELARTLQRTIGTLYIKQRKRA